MQALPHDEPPAITDSPIWTEGDFELISSDSGRFRVPTHYLQSSSTVFRDMIVDGGDNEKCVHFTSDFECSTVLHDFLDLVVNATEFHIMTRGELLVEDDNFEHHVNLLKFLLKYDCQLAKRALLLEVYHYMHRGYATPTFSFTFGAIADDSDLCEEAILFSNRYAHQTPGWFIWEAPKYAIGPSHFGFATWSLISPAYQWALCKTHEAHGIDRCYEGDINDTFFVALKEAKKHESAEASKVAME